MDVGYEMWDVGQARPANRLNQKKLAFEADFLWWCIGRGATKRSMEHGHGA